MITKVFLVTVICYGLAYGVPVENDGSKQCGTDNWDLDGAFEEDTQKCWVTTTCSATAVEITLSVGLKTDATEVCLREDCTNCKLTFDDTEKVFKKQILAAEVLTAADKCFAEDTTTGLTVAGSVKTTASLKYYGATYVSTADVKFNVECAMHIVEDTIVENALLKAVNVMDEKTSDYAQGDIAPIMITSLVTYSDLAVSAYDDGKAFHKADAAKELTTVEKVCLLFKASDATEAAGAKNIEIKQLKFGDSEFRTGQTVNTVSNSIVVIDGSAVDTKIGCIEAAPVTTGIFEARKDFQANCDGTTGDLINCKNRRGVCFHPFAWAKEGNVFFMATIVTYDEVSDLDNAFVNTCAGGKKRRSIEDGNDVKERQIVKEEQIVNALYRMTSALEAESLELKCDNTHVVITIVVLAAVLILSIVVNAFVVFTKLRSGKTGAMA